MESIIDDAGSTGVSSHAAARPKLSFGSWAFAFGPFEDAPWSFEQVCSYVADAGYDGIEINGFRPHPHDEDYTTDASCAALKDMIEGFGLSISAYAPDFRSTPPADVAQADFLRRLDGAVAFCSRMGITTLRTDTISGPGPFDTGRFARLAGAWRAAAQRCADAGVLLVWEFEPGFWLNRPTQVRQLVEEVDHPSFKVLFDTCHAYTGAVGGARQGADPEFLGGGVAEYAALLAGHIGHLHVIDSDGSLHDGETSEHVAFGQGSVPFWDLINGVGPELLALPWWTVDFCFSPTAERDGRLAVPFVRDLISLATRIEVSA